MWHEKRIKFFSNKHAVIGLPMHLTVSIIIGAIALSCILLLILSPCLFPQKIIVNADPVIRKISSSSQNIQLSFEVKDKEGHPIKDANIRVIGLGGAAEGTTDKNGETDMWITVTLDSGRTEGYLSVDVKAGGCYDDFKSDNMIKIYR